MLTYVRSSYVNNSYRIGPIKPPEPEFELVDLFANSEAGFLWPDLPYHQDPAGTTVATWGNPVGLISDDSGNGANFTQPTVTARPVLGRVPVSGRRNLVTASEGVGLWALNAGATVTYDGENPYGNLPSAHVTTSNTSANSGVFRSGSLIAPITQGDQVTLRVAIKPLSVSSPIRVRMEGPAFPSAEGSIVGASCDFTTDTVSPIGSPVSVSMVEGRDGFYEVSITADAAFSGQVTMVAYHSSAIVSEFLLAARQFVLGDSAGPYQAVVSYFDITESGVDSVHYLHLDGTDDSVSTTLPSITNGTVVIAGANGIWIDDDFNHAGGAFTVCPTTYTGGPDGILPIVGDLIVGGSFAIDRQLTAQERTRVINKLKSMGSGEVIV